MKASTDRYVLIKPYSYTLDFLPQILRDYRSVKSDQSLSCHTCLAIPRQPNWWCAFDHALYPSAWHIRSAIPNRTPLFLFMLVFIFGTVWCVYPFPRKTTIVTANALSLLCTPELVDLPPYLQRNDTVAFNSPVCTLDGHQAQSLLPYARRYCTRVYHVPPVLEKFLRTLYFHSLARIRGPARRSTCVGGGDHQVCTSYGVHALCELHLRCQTVSGTSTHDDGRSR